MTQWTRSTGRKDSSLTSRVHVESVDKKHSAFWRHLCDEALRRPLTAAIGRQGTNAALTALLNQMSDVSLELGLLQGYGCIAPVGSARLTSLAWCGRQAVGIWRRNQQRMRRDPEEVEGATLPQNQKTVPL